VNWVVMSSRAMNWILAGQRYLRSPLIPQQKEWYLWTHLGADLISTTISECRWTLARTNQPVKKEVRYNTANPLILDALNASFYRRTRSAKRSNIGCRISSAVIWTTTRNPRLSELLYFAGGTRRFIRIKTLPKVGSPLLSQWQDDFPSTLQQPSLDCDRVFLAKAFTSATGRLLEADSVRPSGAASRPACDSVDRDPRT